LPVCSIQGEERSAFNEYGGSGPLLAYDQPPMRPPTTDLWSAAIRGRASASLLERSSPKTAFLNSATPPGQADNFISGDDFVLMSRKLTSRYGTGSWASLQTGYGQYFANDRIGRSRTSGAGFEDPDFLFVKLMFKF
jgi:hypothetical protein